MSITTNIKFTDRLSPTIIINAQPINPVNIFYILPVLSLIEGLCTSCVKGMAAI